VTADSEDEAFDRLLDAVRGGDKIVLPADRRPNPGEESEWRKNELRERPCERGTT
jgi:hypothetical protein